MWKQRRKLHLILWIAGVVIGLRGAGYLSDRLGGANVGVDGNSPNTDHRRLSSQWDPQVSGNDYSVNSHASSRHLLAMQNCTPRAVEQFPRDVFTQAERMKGALAFHVIGVLYMFLCLAIVCDVYFVPSLEVICEMINMQPDVAGATFMAAGSSAPELATSIIGVFVAKDDVGLSTVVGSAIYNIMFVISVCGFAASVPIKLTWWPLIRDCIAYLVSIVALCVVINDEKVMWYESIIFLALYLGYILFMLYNKRLEKKVLPICYCCPMSPKSIPDKTVIHYEKITEHEANGSVKISGERTPIKQYDLIDKSSTFFPTENHEVPLDEEECESVWQLPKGRIALVLWILAVPANALMYISMPDCRKPRFRRWFWITFLLSLVWLSAFSFLMVWMITVIGYSVNIPDSVMSLTFVAFGVSLPDVVASVLVIKDGLGDMAVSNAVGSNVFDILVCLGIPWCIKTCFLNPGSHVIIYSEGLLYSSITLLSTVLILVIGIHLNKWYLNRKISAFFMVTYVAFTALSCLYELNIFGYFHPDECHSDY